MPPASIANPPQAAADPFGNTDELLSQLAGNEIDRLLSEANADFPPNELPADTAEKTVAGASEITETSNAKAAATPEPASMTAELDALFAELQQTSTGGTAAPVGENAKPPAAPSPVAQTSGSAAEPEKQDAPQGAERAAMLKAAGFDDETAPPAPPTDENEIDDVLEQPGTERSALLAAAGFDGPESPNADVAAAEASAESDEPLAGGPELAEESADDERSDEFLAAFDDVVPFYLKPLEWINAPLESCTPAFRQFLGQAGILTMVISVAVLTYVWISHRH